MQPQQQANTANPLPPWMGQDPQPDSTLKTLIRERYPTRVSVIPRSLLIEGSVVILGLLQICVGLLLILNIVVICNITHAKYACTHNSYVICCGLLVRISLIHILVDYLQTN